MTEGYFENREWVEAKIGKFSGSEMFKLFKGPKNKIDGLFGDVAYGYIYDKAAEIITQELTETPDLKAFEWGKANEVDAKVEYEKATGFKGDYYGTGNPRFFSHDDWLGVSPDWFDPKNKRGAQFKCPIKSSNHLKYFMLRSAAELKKKFDLVWYQIQTEMYVMDANSWDFVSYDPRPIDKRYRLKIITVYPETSFKTDLEVRLEAAKYLIERILHPEEPVQEVRKKIIESTKPLFEI